MKFERTRIEFQTDIFVARHSRGILGHVHTNPDNRDLLIDSKTSTTTSTRFSQYYVVRARKPASFWRENVVAVVILLRVLARMSKWRKQDIKC